MKRLLLACMMILCLVPMGMCAEEETTPALYPIRENGLWGYMNRAGEAVIEPQWDSVSLFYDHVAGVSVETNGEPVYGLIDRNGDTILSVEYQTVKTSGGFCYWDDRVEYWKEGFYDIASRSLLPPVYDMVHDWGGELLVVEDGSEEDGGLRYGFIRRDTGEVVFPLQFDGLYEDVGCAEGYVLAAYERGEQGDGSVWGPDYHLYDLTGKEILFPDGIKPDSCVYNGVLRIMHELDEDEEAAHPTAWGMVYGLGKPDGTVIVEPQYDYLEFAGEGLFSVYQDGQFGVMDTSGRMTVYPQYYMDWGGPLPCISYQNGYAVIDEDHEDRCVMIDTEGREVFTIPERQSLQETGEERFFALSAPAENGCFWIHSWSLNREGPYPERENDSYELMRIVDRQAKYLSETRYDSIAARIPDADCEQTEVNFAEGVQAVCLNGLWGYIDENGQEALPFKWDAACNFYEGLALVEKNGKLMYIDHRGAVVWEEE